MFIIFGIFALMGCSEESAPDGPSGGTGALGGATDGAADDGRGAATEGAALDGRAAGGRALCGRDTRDSVPLPGASDRPEPKSAVCHPSLVGRRRVPPAT